MRYRFNQQAQGKEGQGLHWTQAGILALALVQMLAGVGGVSFNNANEEAYIQGEGAKQISDINLLLPISHAADQRRVSYNISAINGCYNWEVSHPNLLGLTQIKAPGYSQCANIATIQPISLKASKSLIWITARDSYSGQTIRCETKLGIIHRLEIQTHFRQFYVDNYEQLHLVAFDEEGNIFNSLDGFRFDWTIDRGTDIVKIVTVKEAGQKFSENQNQLEANKLFSDKLFLKGLKSGTAEVSVSIVEEGYEHITKAKVYLTITEPFVIIPSHTVYLLPTSRYQFQLAKVSLKNHEMQFFPITLPNKQYLWNVDNESRGDIGEDGLFISKDKEGMVGLYVVDQHIQNNTAEGSVKVVYPHSLDLEIVDVTDQMQHSKTFLVDDLKNSFYQQLDLKGWDSNWVLVEGHFYYIKIFVFDKDKNPIQLTDNLVFDNNINSEYFDIIKKNSIESEVIVYAKKTTEPNQKLFYVSVFQSIKSAHRQLVFAVDQTRLRQEKEVRITKPVHIIHPTNLVLLPLIKSSIEEREGEIWQLEAEGGSGYYQWSIRHDSVAKVSGSGLLRSREIGTTQVIVKDNLNHRNSYELDVEVTHVFYLKWLEDHIEVQRDNEVATLNVIALDKQGRKFTNCTAIHAKVDLFGETLVNLVPTTHSYRAIRDYVFDHTELITLRQQFDENPNAIVASEVRSNGPYTPEKESLILHNNFGICSQQKVKAVGEGLARGRAYYANYDQANAQSFKSIESDFVEIAAYDKLTSIKPNFNNFFSDLFTLNSVQTQEESMFSKEYVPMVFDLAFGSSLTWEVHGGTNFWKDIADKYQTTHEILLVNQEEGGLDPDILHFEKTLEQTNNFKYQVTCLNPKDKNKLSKPHRFRLTITQFNIQNRYLLKPAKHYADIKIHCEPPQSQRTYWAQESRDLNSIQYKRLPRFKVISSEKVSYVLVNSKHYVRSLFYDNSNYVFYNYSSISNTFSSSNEKMLQLYPLRQDYEHEVIDNVYDKRRVEVFNITGSVYIHTYSNGYYKAFFSQPLESKGYGYFSGGGGSPSAEQSGIEKLHLNHDVKDSMKIEVVLNVDIQPKFKCIYLSSNGEFTFRILHGSGHFQVHLNNSDLANLTQRDGNITIYPQKEGSLEIRVEDVEVPDSVQAVAELLISDIDRLELDAPGSLIEQGSKMELSVTAFDKHGVAFDADQYKYMNFYMEIERGAQRPNGLTTIPDIDDNREFVALGLEPGNYQVLAYAYKHRSAISPYRTYDQQSQPKPRVISEVLKIEVFPLLEIHPNTLLLTPLMRYTLQIIGGPSGRGANALLQGSSVEIKFDIEDKSIATVDAYTEVVGHSIGDTNLYYEIIQLKPTKGGVQKRSIVSKKTIPIRVRLITSIEIPQNNQRNVFEESLVKLIGILKYEGETFTHGVAPISYSWNSSNPAIASLQIPSKEGQNKILGSNLVMTSKKIRDNEQSKNDVVFMSQFNSSTIYLLAKSTGKAQISLLLAIEYPDKYKYNKNYFTTSILLSVSEQLQIDVAEFMNKPDKQTHLYMMPPNTLSKVVTNKKTRLRLGYSMQSVYDYSTKSYQYVESETPIIQLINDESIKTSDKFGKVTVIVEENQSFSGQVVMLNVLVTDIYNIAVQDAYQAMNLPLGSKMVIPLKYQNENAHLFAKNIEGISVGIELSHPRVVTASLDENNSTLTLKASGSGDCNVIVYLSSNPSLIYDVFRVKVTSIVKPPSPVSIHVGGQVTFKIMGEADQSKETQNIVGGTIWSSNNPAVLDINQLTGEGKGLSEGEVEVMLSNHINAASIVQVSKVKYAEIDERYRKNLVMVTDSDSLVQGGEARFRIKLFFKDQIEEVMPSVQFDGVTLIKQNVGLVCESDSSAYIDARAEISELEGYFCVLRLKELSQTQRQQIPKLTKVSVFVYGPAQNEPVGSVLYKDKIIQFEVSLISNIKVESLYRSAVRLNRDYRGVDVKVFSNVDFTVNVENQAEADKGNDLLRYKVNKTDAYSNEYYLSMTVPQEITHSFKSNVILTHPVTGQKTSIPIYFDSEASGSTGQERYRSSDYYGGGDEGEGFFSGLYNLFFRSPPSVSQPSREEYQGASEVYDKRHDRYEEPQTTYHRRHEPEQPSFFSYLMVLLIILVLFLFCLQNILRVNLRELYDWILNGRLGQGRSIYRQQPHRAYERAPGRTQVRDVIGRNNLFGNVNAGAFNQNPRQSPKFNTPQGEPPRGVSGSVRGMNLQNYQYSAQSDRQNQSSIYNSNSSPSSQRRLIS